MSADSLIAPREEWVQPCTSSFVAHDTVTGTETCETINSARNSQKLMEWSVPPAPRPVRDTDLSVSFRVVKWNIPAIPAGIRMKLITMPHRPRRVTSDDRERRA
jgi:hypothetical protein